MKKSLSMLDRIRAIIESDIATIEKVATKALDATSAKKLCDYAKLEIALQRHDADLAEAEEANELARQEYEALKEQVQKALTAKPADDLEDDDQ